MVYLLKYLVKLLVGLRFERLRIGVALHYDLLHVLEIVGDLFYFFDQLRNLVVLLLAHFDDFLTDFDLKVLYFGVERIETGLLHDDNFVDVCLRYRNLFLQFLLHLCSQVFGDVVAFILLLE